MRSSKKEIAQAAIVTALRTRTRAGYKLDVPISVFDMCDRLNVSVLFQDIPSMEGIYLPDARPKPAILVSSHRPSGRQSITCGHELGHHVFGHGKQWDELVEDRSNTRHFEPEEFQADLFSAALQMPKAAVTQAASLRSIDLAECPPVAVYSLSTLFGVSYAAFVTHAEQTLKLISEKRAFGLLKQLPQNIRSELFGGHCPQNLIVADQHWNDRAIDVQVGDSVILPPRVAIEGQCGIVVSQTNDRTIVDAVKPGLGRLRAESGWSAFLRVMRKHYAGLSRLRFEEEVDDDD